MKRITILTLFPDMFEGFLNTSIIKKARLKGLVDIEVVDFRPFTLNKNNRVDEYPYGGGSGMVLMCQPLLDCLKSVRRPQSHVVLMDPSGQPFSQKKAHSLEQKDDLILICGHYEGYDARIRDYVDESISIGDYILTGGELGAMVVADAVTRLVPGVIREESTVEESFENDLLEYPQYTHPVVYEGKKVPDVLLSGNHENVRKYRLYESLKKTWRLRPDLLEKHPLTQEEKKMLADIKAEAAEEERDKLMEKTKIILDCDPGHDDAVAILMAGKHPSLDLLGITCVAGNQTLQKTVTNALKVTQHVGLDTNVYAGSPRPLVEPARTAANIHGVSGLDGPVFEPLTKKVQPMHAVSYLIRTLMASEGDITVVATGPLTNIALAMRMEPRIVDKIKQIVIMGGSSAGGNWTPAAEFNIFCDGEAARIVFESGRPIVMCGLDVTRKVLCYQSVIDRMNALGNQASTLFKDMMEFYNLSQKKIFGLDGGPLHDPVTIAYLIDPSVLKLNHCYVEIDIRSVASYGRTNCDLNHFSDHEPNADVAVDIDVDKFWSIVEECLRLYS
jgi:ribosylpyrimidine nucleosidase